MPESQQPPSEKHSREKQKWEKMTQDTAAKRWIKKYKGKRFQSTSVGLTREGHKLAWEQFEKWRAGIDQQPAVNPFAADYETAIRLRKQIAAACSNWIHRQQNDPEWRQRNTLGSELAAEHWRTAFFGLETDESEPPITFDDLIATTCPAEIELYRPFRTEPQRRLSYYSDLYASMVSETATLQRWEKKRKPKPLDQPNSMPVAPPLLALTTDPEVNHWNRDLIEQYDIRLQWLKPVDAERTIAHQVERYVAMQLARAKAGEITPARFGVIRMHATAFGNYAGGIEVKAFAETDFSGFHATLLAAVQSEQLSKRTAADRLAETKSFLTWLDSERILPHLPRNLSRLRIKVPQTDPPALTDQQIESVLGSAKGRTRLYVLMMLNCGMTQVDLADVTHSQIDWIKGTVTRKRSKTEEIKSVPTVTHVLWDETLQLLQEHASSPESLRVLLTQDGLPLVKKVFRNGSSRVSNNDAVRLALRRIKTKVGFPLTPKLFRKSSARKLKSHEGEYSRPTFIRQFLGHSLKSVEEKKYAGGVPFEQFGPAVQWLGEQWGFATSRR